MPKYEFEFRELVVEKRTITVEASSEQYAQADIDEFGTDAGVMGDSTLDYPNLEEMKSLIENDGVRFSAHPLNADSLYPAFLARAEKTFLVSSVVDIKPAAKHFSVHPNEIHKVLLGKPNQKGLVRVKGGGNDV